MNRRVVWQEKKRAQGLCTTCGSRPILEGSRCACTECLLRRRYRKRRIGGHQPRQGGGRGRPPIYIPASPLKNSA